VVKYDVWGECNEWDGLANYDGQKLDNAINPVLKLSDYVISYTPLCVGRRELVEFW
jgi:hypothetical protein